MGILIVIGKLTFTALTIYVLSEIAKRSTTVASLLASLPVTSVLVATLLYWETGDVEQVAKFTNSLLWLIYPSLTFFVIFPILLRRGMGYGGSLTLSLTIMIVFYGLYALVLRWFSIKL